MARNNVKLLTEEQLSSLNRRYIFEPRETDILVMVIGYRRQTIHPYNENFSINAKERKVTFTTEAIEFWRRLYDPKKRLPSLLDVQQAYNILLLTHQPIDERSIRKMLKTGPKIQNFRRSDET